MTTFAVVAGAAGASLDSPAILIFGFSGNPFLAACLLAGLGFAPVYRCIREGSPQK